MDAKTRDRVSRQLTKILRHQIVELDLTCDGRGFVAVNDIFQSKRIKIPRASMEDIQLIVSENTKKRLELDEREGVWYIRAVQGHNKDVGDILCAEAAFEVIIHPLPFCAHGTESRFVSSIQTEGLKRMSRQHIHLVSEIHEDRHTSGYKARSNAIVVIDMARCMADGIVFLLAANGVVLTEGIGGCIPPQYILEVRVR